MDRHLLQDSNGSPNHSRSSSKADRLETLTGSSLDSKSKRENRHFITKKHASKRNKTFPASRKAASPAPHRLAKKLSELGVETRHSLHFLADVLGVLVRKITEPGKFLFAFAQNDLF